MNQTKMSRYFFLAIVSVCLMGIASCSPEPDVVNDPANNTTDMAVTGLVENFSVTDANIIASRGEGICAEISGYLNLTDQIKATLGIAASAFSYGVEVSSNSSFSDNETQRFAASRLNDRRFVVSVGVLRESTQYYYRTFFRAGTFYAYGNVSFFTTPTIQESFGRIVTPDPTRVEMTQALITPEKPGVEQIAYDTDYSKLTVDNIRNGRVSVSNGNLDNLATGTTYFYCAVRIIRVANSNASGQNVYVAMGDMKSFTTGGLNVNELARYVSSRVSYDERTYMWKADITTTLGDRYAGHDVKYGIYCYLETSYRDESNPETPVSVAYWVNTGGVAYATGSGNQYTATVSNAEYYGTVINGELIEPTSYWGAANVEDLVKNMKALKEKEEKNIITNEERDTYEAMLEEVLSEFSGGYFRYASSVLAVFVEIDGTKYFFHEQPGSLRLPWYLVGYEPWNMRW